MVDRTAAAQSTWDRIQPAIEFVGVTRIADLTWLDQIGIPCAQAIRPASRTLSVAQGKGLTPLAAALSAAMESIEVWHAENLGPPDLVATVGEVRDSLGYPLEGLRLTRRNHLNSGTRLAWTAAFGLLTGSRTLLPTASLRLDSTVETVWQPINFQVTSNGLASGMDVWDATLHGLYEVVERDALAHAEHGVWVSLDSLTGIPAELAERFRAAGVTLAVEALDSPIGVPCFRVRAFSEDFPADFCGTAAHADPHRALTTAMTEAAQARIATITGTREDLGDDLYRNGDPVDPALDGRFAQAGEFRIDPLNLPDEPERAAIELAERVRRWTGHQPLVVHHTRADLGIPVVRVVCPGMRCPDDY
ncbi:ribosomal protein S12 methylthiotransferase accessory factor [Lentzea albidocapillata subsp. violacea]|uniref:Ribosomal protein S12 methylthiotransferase accessory factor n=1 Tax=Lentzea albidocapillata subsp. violacea TaxID=128104 RepID=A0A1G9XV39_9PSEU|nr:YcaO-like family protein [Lentzea albidocapillata]SDN00667.1 ribosomal protein S12 methylthiotransferase accessory factor [Lentzea albidocapillata subsp. violacea]